MQNQLLNIGSSSKPMQNIQESYGFENRQEDILDDFTNL